MSSFARLFAATDVIDIAEVAECGAYSRSFEPDGENQDGVLVARRDQTILLAVADGVGGLPGGARASKSALNALAASFERGQSALYAIERANEAVRRVRGSATTLVVAEIQGRALRTYHAGDSQCVVFSGQRRLKGITVAHSVTGLGVEAGLLRSDEVALHPERHVVTNTLGDQFVRVEVTRWPRLNKRDYVLLASDGLFDNFENTELGSLMGSSVDASLRAITEECNLRMASGRPGTKEDDLSIALWRRLA